jgi:predicted MFS family arabinose efflux permease
MALREFEPVARPEASGQRIGGRWTVLFLLVAANTLNLFDRQLPFILIEHIRADLQLTDTQIGLLGGLAFSLVYAVMAIPLARVSDSRSRKWVMVASVGIWSLMTAAGGLARNFAQLAVSRAGVAVAEAGCSPTSHSLIADLFPDRRSFALALFTAGVPAGIMLGLATGGLLVEHMGWRQVLFLAGVPGVVLAIAFAVVLKEPPRRRLKTSAGPRTFLQALGVLWRRPSFGWITAGATLNALATAGGAAFGAAFLMRVYQFSAAEAGLMLGALGGIVSVTGTVTAGALGDWIARDNAARRLRTVAIALMCSTPLYVAAKLAPTPLTFFLLSCGASLIGSFWLPLTFAATQSVVSSDMRATTSAVMQLIFNVLGAVIGPILVGVLSDRWSGLAGVRSLGWALAAVGLVGFVAAACYWIAAGRHNRDVAAAVAEEAV